MGTSGIIDRKRLERAMNPAIPVPANRSLRVFAFDPLLGLRLETMGMNQTLLQVRWEENLQPGPIGEYLEVLDVDPGSNCSYAPIDLNASGILSQDGLSPAEGNPQFHQQMAYAVAMKTIEYFEKALGRRALWAPRMVREGGEIKDHYVKRLRIYPHGLREANSYYSPDKNALLFGYFPASKVNPGDNLPGGMIFCCLSHDIVAHETTHALLDGLHRRYRESTNPDAPAFHEAFADIVALMQHFSVPEALKDQIRKTKGDLSRQNILGELAQQFGQGIGHFGALRSAIGQTTTEGKWEPVKPSREDYNQSAEAHDLGAVLVAAIFDAFLGVYRTRCADLLRLATGGTGILPKSQIPEELVNRLSLEAGKTAEQILNICIRALDYCPPVDITFGEYLRALITADRDLVPDDKMGYRVAFISAFARRGIYPKNVRNLSADSLVWESPDVEMPDLHDVVRDMNLAWDLHYDREKAFQVSKKNAAILHKWLSNPACISDETVEGLGFVRGKNKIAMVNGVEGEVSPFEVHSVRPARRIGPNGEHLVDLVIEITQSWSPTADGAKEIYRGGCTLLIDLETLKLRYCICKRVAHPQNIEREKRFRAIASLQPLSGNYFDNFSITTEPFAMRNRMS